MEFLKCDMCWSKILRLPDGTFQCRDCDQTYTEEEIREIILEATDGIAVPYTLGPGDELMIDIPEEEEPELPSLEWESTYPRFGAPNARNLASIRAANAPLKGLVIDCGSYIRTPDGRTIRAGTLRTVPEQFDVRQWYDIVQLAFGDQLVGLRADGAVFTFATRGKKDDGHLIQLFGPEEQITQITVSTGSREKPQVVCGLRKDGTVIAQCDAPEEDQIVPAVARWSGVEAIYGTYNEVLAVCTDGSVLSTREDYSYLEDVVAIAVKRYGDHPMFLHSDGTISFSRQKMSQLDFSYRFHKTYETIKNWRDIADITYGNDCLIGWKEDGSLVAETVDTHNGSIAQAQCREACQWNNIVAIYSKYNGFVGLRKDGTFAYAPTADRYGQQSVGIEKLFTDFRTVSKELYDGNFRKAIREYRKKAAVLEEEQAQLAAQLPELNGFFSGSKRKKVQERLLVIEQALKALRREENALFEKE